MRRSEATFLFDTGPPKPVAPVAPPQPVGIAGSAPYELAKLGYRLAIQDYRAERAEYEDAMREWRKYEGGPVKIFMASQDAKEAIANDARAVAEGRQAALRYYRIMPT